MYDKKHKLKLHQNTGSQLYWKRQKKLRVQEMIKWVNVLATQS